METVRVREPRTDIPMGADPFLGPQLKSARSWMPSVTALLAVCVVLMALSIRLNVLIGLPAMLFTGCGLAALLCWWATGPGPALRLRDAYFREIALTEGSVLVAGAKVSLALPDGGWAVFRTFECNRLLIAGMRKAWVLGPDKRGSVVVVVPGMLTGWTAKVAREPAPGSRPSYVTRVFGPPREDPVVRAYWQYTQKLTAVMMVVYVLVLAGMVGASTIVSWPMSLPPLALTGFAAVVIVVALIKTLVWGRSAYATGWTELDATLDAPIKHSGTAIASGTGRVTLADGRVVRVKFAMANVNLLANIEATGRMWVFGEPKPGKAVRVGLPGYPLLSNVKLG